MIDLHEMRNHPALKWGMYFFFGVIIVSFIFFYGWSPNKKETDLVYAKIKGPDGWHAIKSADLQWAKDRAIAEKQALLPPQARNLPPSVAEALVTTPEIAEAAANDFIVQHEADEYGLEISRDDIITLLRQQPGITDELIQREANTRGLTINGLIDFMRKSQQEMLVRQLKSLTVSPSLYEVWQEYSLAKEKLKMQMAAYPVDSYTTGVTVTENDLQQFLDTHKDDFKVPDQRRYAFAKADKYNIRESLQVTTTAVQTYYDQNKGDFLEKAAFRTAEIVAPLAMDRSSTEAAKVLNDARGRAGAIGDWAALSDELRKAHPGMSFYHRTSAWLTGAETDQRSPVFLSAAAALTSDSATTTIVEKDNVYLIKVIERRPEGTPPLESIRMRVTDAWRDAEAQRQFDAAAQRWDAEVGKYKSIAELAQAMGVKDEVTTRIEKSNPTIPGFTSMVKDRAYLDALGLNEVSALVKNDTVVGALQVIEEVPAHDATLAEVRERVETALKRERAAELAKQAAEQSMALIKQGAPLEQALANAPVGLFTTPNFSRREPIEKLQAPLQEFTTQSLALAPGTTGLNPYGPSGEKPLGYAVWRLDAILAPDRREFANDRAKFVKDFLEVQRLAILREWLKDARERGQFEIVANKTK